MSKIDKILENLNEQQKLAVTQTEGFVRVISGAGSGKTKTLISRYAYIVETIGINPSNILCVTFTNKAANEMRTRVKKLIGENSDLSYITTYHGFCVRVLREEVNKIQYPRRFIIMDVEDQKIVLREVFKELGINSKVLTFKRAFSYISENKNSLEYIDNDYISTSNSENSTLQKVFIKYIEKQRKNFALDFDDLLNYTLYIFNKFKDILLKWQNRLHYIQVDETQDSSPKQFNLVQLLSERHKNLFVVGDPDQTIYEWRGATPEILVDFDKRFPTAKTILMNQNYRSTPNILKLGNHIIKKNKIRIDKEMFTLNNQGLDVIHFHAKNDFDEGLWISNEINNLILDKNAKYSDIAILYRANHISRMIEQSLVREDIPYTIFGGVQFFERKEIKDILSYLRLIVNGDDFSFLRVINQPTRGLGKKFIENLSIEASKSSKSLLNTLQNNIDKKDFARKGAKEFLNLIAKFEQRKDEIKISDLIKEILDESGLTELYSTDGDVDRLENIKELQNSIIFLERNDNESITLENYLQEIALYTNMDIDNRKTDRVKLMTIHTSKGLEFPYVFLCGFTEGILPSAMSIRERRLRGLEEERRLTYVAITRAEKAFYITEAEGFNFTTGLKKYPSRFLFEINEKLFVRKGVLSQELIDEAKKQLENDDIKPINIINKFNINDVVKHPTFGVGKIVEINKSKSEYQIYFEDSDLIKHIVFEFDDLTKISAKNIQLPTDKLNNTTGTKSISTIDINSDTYNKTKKISFLSRLKDLFK